MGLELHESNIRGSYATGNPIAAGPNSQPFRLLGYNQGDGSDMDGNPLVGEAGRISQSYGFGSPMDDEDTSDGSASGGVHRSDDGALPPNPDALVLNSLQGADSAATATYAGNLWNNDVWDFGTNSQPPVLKWVAGVKINTATATAEFYTDPASIPAAMGEDERVVRITLPPGASIGGLIARIRGGRNMNHE